jgi:vanillate O-demethylase ferredoxin subunit
VRLQQLWTEAVVVEAGALTPSVRGVAVQPSDGTRDYTPGSHILIEIPTSRPSTRCYSLVGAHRPGLPYRIAVRRHAHSRGGSHYVWSLEKGDRVRIGHPQNLFELNRRAPAQLLVAGGIGITPLVGMAQALAESRASFELLYCGSNRKEMPFVGELRELLGQRLRLFVSGEGQRLSFDSAIASLPPDGELYVCGPPRMLDAATRAWQAAGRAPARLRFETFGSGGHRPPEPFTVLVQEQGIEVNVPPDQTMLESLRAAGVEVMADCLRGECGVCLVDIVNVEGSIDHADVFLSAAERAENDRICPCVSRAVGRLTIDTGFRLQ